KGPPPPPKKARGARPEGRGGGGQLSLRAVPCPPTPTSQATSGSRGAGLKDEGKHNPALAAPRLAAGRAAHAVLEEDVRLGEDTALPALLAGEFEVALHRRILRSNPHREGNQFVTWKVLRMLAHWTTLAVRREARRSRTVAR